MQTRIGSSHRSLDAASRQRKALPDIPNLFGLVAPAKSLFNALGEAGMHGGQLLSHLPATDPAARDMSLVDIGARLADLAPMMQAFAGARIALHADVAILHSRVRMISEDFDAVILALIANAVAAEAKSIAVRNRVVDARIWTLVSDDGRGMGAPELARARARSRTNTESAHGSGLSRVHRFVGATQGQLLMRSHPGAGTSIALILPVLPSTAMTCGASRTNAFLKPKETIDEKDRQRTAA